MDPNSAEINNPSLKFGGIPIRVDPMIPDGEVWLVNEGRRSTIRIHEGQQAGQTVEEWLTKPTVYRIVNLGEGDSFNVKPPQRVYLSEIGHWPWPDGDKK